MPHVEFEASKPKLPITADQWRVSEQFFTDTQRLNGQIRYYPVNSDGFMGVHKPAVPHLSILAYHSLPYTFEATDEFINSIDVLGIEDIPI